MLQDPPAKEPPLVLLDFVPFISPAVGVLYGVYYRTDCSNTPTSSCPYLSTADWCLQFDAYVMLWMFAFYR